MGANSTITLFPKQSQFLYSNKKEVMFSGGYGSSKSYALCLALLKHAQVKGARCLLLRKTLTSLKKSTLDTLIGNDNPILPIGSYTHHKQDGIIKLHGGGEIWYAGLDNPTRIRSTQFSMIAIDEVSELTEAEYLEILYRLRSTIGTLQLLSATNPATQNHHLYKRFFLDKSYNREVITACSLDNTFLPKSYIESLKEMSGVRYKKYVEGIWCALDNAIYDNFSRDIHVTHLKPTVYDEIIMGIDMGYQDPFVLLVIGRQGDRLFLLEEYYKPKMLMDDIKATILNFSNKYDRPIVVVDPSAALLIAELNNIGCNAIKAINDIKIGIERVRNRLRVRNDSPDLIIDDKCVNTIAEFENYGYKDETETPIDANNHAMDVIRYILNYIEDKKCSYQIPIVYSGEELEYEEDLL